MDVHKNTYSVCCYNLNDGEVRFKAKFAATTLNLLKYLEKAKNNYPLNTRFICGYEAGFSGYSIYRELEKYAVECKVLAPSTITNIKNKRIKTDARDAENIAKSMAFNTVSEVYVLTEEDEAVREYIRMRDDHKEALKKVKMQILFLLKRQNIQYTLGKKYWSQKFMAWIKELKFELNDVQETFDEYMSTYFYLSQKVERLDMKIEEISQREKYREKCNRLKCLIGIKTHVAMSCIVEIGDFRRFEKAKNFAAFLGFIPSEYSSGEKINKGSITKSGNKNLRKLITEAAQGYTHGRVGFKSKAVLNRQKNCDAKVVAYADKANERLRKRFYVLTLKKEMNRNKAKTAIARELSCFIWGLMTDNIAA